MMLKYLITFFTFQIREVYLLSFMIEDFLWNLDDLTNEEDWGWWLSVGGSPADQDKITAARMMMDEEAMLSKLPI